MVMMTYFVFKLYRAGRWGWTVERRPEDSNSEIEMMGFFESKKDAEDEAQRQRLIDQKLSGELPQL
jgi:hypothetical protein